MSPGQYEDCTHSQLRNRIHQLEFEKAAIITNLRDEFAKAAMGSYIVALASHLDEPDAEPVIATLSYMMADAMLKERQ